MKLPAVPTVVRSEQIQSKQPIYGVVIMKKTYEKPELIEYDNLNEITCGGAGS